MARGHGLPSSRIMRCTIAVCVVLMTLCFVVGTPKYGGPDEPSHAVASAALVRGQRPIVFSADVTPEQVYRVPGFVGRPDPGCYALQSSVPASCIDGTEADPGEVTATSRAGWYPIWGHLAAGAASLVAWPSGYLYLARLSNAVVPVVLLIASLFLLRRRSTTAAVAALVGFTPIAWFSLGIVNPSSLAITGGLALWVGLLDVDWRRADSDMSIGWLAVGGFVALELARRDGALWSTVLVVVVCISRATPPSRVWGALSGGARSVVLATVVLQAVGKIESQAARADAVLAVAPLGLVVAEVVYRSWRGASARLPRRTVTALGVTGGLVTAGLTLVVLDHLRLGGLQFETIRNVVSATGGHARQLVGLMGWLDAPTPELAVFLWWTLIGMMFAIALVQRPRSAAAALLALAAAAVMAWVLEIGASSVIDRVWQGRYSLPLTVGVPLLLAVACTAVAPPRRLLIALAVGMWSVINLAFLNTQRRWAVGVEGSLLPWDWDTWGAPVSPLVLVIVHLVASAVLAAACVAPLDRRDASGS